MSDNLPAQMHSPTGTAVATRTAQDTHTLDANDVRLPRMKLAQLSTKLVEAGVATYGQVFVAYGQDDLEPVVLAEAPKAQGELGPEVLFYVLDVEKGYSYTDPNKRLGRTQDGSYPDLSLVKDGDPRNVRRTYDYTIVLPGAFEDLPVKFIMHGQWGGQAAKSMNTRIALANRKGVAMHEQPFKLQVKKTQNDNGAFAQAIIAPATVTAKDRKAHAELVGSFLDLVQGGVSAVEDDVPAAAPTAQPSID